MPEISSVVYRFSPEELVVLYHEATRATDALPYEDLLPDYNEEQRVLALDVARRGLIARGTLEAGTDGNYRLDELAIVATAVGLITNPVQSILRLASNGRFRIFEIYELDATTRVMHSRADDGLHEYSILNDDEIFFATVCAVANLPIDHPTVDLEIAPPVSLALSTEAFNAALTSGINQDSVTVTTILTQNGASEKAAQLFAKTLTSECEQITFVRHRPAGSGAQSEDAIAFVQGADRWWQFTEVEENTVIGLQERPIHAVIEIIKRLVNERSI